MTTNRLPMDRLMEAFLRFIEPEAFESVSAKHGPDIWPFTIEARSGGEVWTLTIERSK